MTVKSDTTITYTWANDYSGFHFEMKIELNGTPYTIRSFIYGRDGMSNHLDRHLMPIVEALKNGGVVEIIDHHTGLLRNITTPDEYNEWVENIMKVLKTPPTEEDEE